MCRIILVFELYTQDRPDRGLLLRFLSVSFGEERASFSLISGLGFKKFGRALCARYLSLKLLKLSPPLKAAGYPHKAQENKRSHTDSISPSLAAEGVLHE